MIKQLFLSLFMLTACSSLAAERMLYDGTSASSPTVAGWTLISTPFVGNRVSETVGATGVTLDSTTTTTDQGGYFSNLITPALVLSPSDGFTVKWRATLNSELHVGNDRAGFSVLVVAENLQALELGIWPGEVWAQNGLPNIFTHGEGVAIDTTVANDYELEIIDTSYTLRVNGGAVLSGATRDYSSFNPGLPINPYTTPNMIFLGDDTGSAHAAVFIESISLVTPSLLAYDDGAASTTLVFGLNPAGDTLEVRDAGGTLLTSGLLTDHDRVVINGGAGDDVLQIDFANGSPIPSGGLVFNGGPQDLADTLSIINGSFGPVVIDALNGNDGVIDVGGGTITFTGLEPVDMSGSTATDLYFNFPATDDTIHLTSLGGTSNRLASADAVPTFESTDFVRPTGTLNIDGGGGSDTVFIVDDFVNGRHNVTTEIFRTSGFYQFNNATLTADQVFINSTNATASETMTIGNGALAQISGNLQLGGVISTNNYRGNVNQAGTARVVIGGDLVFGGVDGAEGGTYDLTSGELEIAGSVIETSASVDAAQFQLHNGTASIAGDITVQRFSVGQNAGADFTYDVPADQAIRTTGAMVIGSNGKGILLVTNALATVTNLNATVGEQSTGTGQVVFANGGDWTVEEYLRIGQSGTGLVHMVSGTLTAGTSAGGTKGIRIAENVNGVGRLIIGSPGGSGTADPVINNEFGNLEDGDDGRGEIIMHHGTLNQLSNNIIIGQVAGSQGTFMLMDGLVKSANNLRIGNTGTGLFEQVNGSVELGSALDLGNNNGARGTYIMHGGSLALTNNIIVGNVNGGAGSFEMNGGTINAGTSFLVGNQSNAQGRVTITGGDINVGTRVPASMNVGQLRGSSGTVLMQDGRLTTATALLIGQASSGRFDLEGGTVDVGTLMTVGNANHGQGTLRMTGGTLNVGVLSPGNLTIGNANTNTTTGVVEIIDGEVNVTQNIRLAENANSTGTLIIGSPDGSTAPTVNANTNGGGNFETADAGEGTFTFHSGVFNMSTNNLITGQAVGSVANVQVGGSPSEARMELTGGNGNIDWNSNGGLGIVNVLSNGVINVGRNINMGSNVDTNSGLALTINGGTVRIGAAGAVGTISYRNDGPRDQIDLLDGLLVANRGTLNFNDTAGTNFLFAGGVLAHFRTVSNGSLTQDGGLLRIGDTNLIGQMFINGAWDYTQNAGALEIDIKGSGGFDATNGHDRLIVGGDVTLAGSLQIVSPFAANLNDTFTIVQNNGTNLVSGTFAGLPEGATVNGGASRFTISYVGGTGNDIVLTAIPSSAELSAQSPQRESGGVRLFFTGLPDTEYTVQFADNTGLLPWIWQDIGPITSEPDGQFNLFRVPASNAEVYRAIR